MNKLSSSLKKGFTLIEILIVISLLGILAVALLATIDPVEQINRGTDSSTQTSLTEVNGGLDRYYSNRQEYPWTTTSPVPAVLTANANLTAIINAGELKSNFTTVAATQITKIYLSGTPSSKVLCFQPVSKSMLYDKNSVYTDNAGTGPSSTCKGYSPPGATNCWWCLKS